MELGNAKMGVKWVIPNNLGGFIEQRDGLLFLKRRQKIWESIGFYVLWSLRIARNARMFNHVSRTTMEIAFDGLLHGVG